MIVTKRKPHTRIRFCTQEQSPALSEGGMCVCLCFCVCNMCRIPHARHTTCAFIIYVTSSRTSTTNYWVFRQTQNIHTHTGACHAKLHTYERTLAQHRHERGHDTTRHDMVAIRHSHTYTQTHTLFAPHLRVRMAQSAIAPRCHIRSTARRWFGWLWGSHQTHTQPT